MPAAPYPSATASLCRKTFHMNADRFAKLAELRQTGLITEAEYEEQKGRLFKPVRPPSRWQRWVGLILAFLFLVWLGTPRWPVGFPVCDASATRELVRQVIEGADDNRQVTRRLLALDQIRELSFDAEKQDRTCVGSAVLNAGERRILWRLYVRGDRILVNVSEF